MRNCYVLSKLRISIALYIIFARGAFKHGPFTLKSQDSFKHTSFIPKHFGCQQEIYSSDHFRRTGGERPLNLLENIQGRSEPCEIRGRPPWRAEVSILYGTKIDSGDLTSFASCGPQKEKRSSFNLAA